MQMTDCNIVITEEQYEELAALDLYEIEYNEDDGTFFIQCYEDDDCIDTDFLEALSDMKVTGQIKFYQGPTGIGRIDYSIFGYDFEHGIMQELEAVVTWHKVTPKQ